MCDQCNAESGLVAVKRKYYPNWFYALAIVAFGQLVVKQPLRWILHKELQ